MSLTDDLLKPIADDRPAGASLRYDPLFDRIREARRQDEGGVVAEGAPKAADHKLVIKLASEALASKSKDLQLAVWLIDSLIYRDGFEGLWQGLDLLRGLLEQFWDGLYPEIEDGDLELRAAPLDWFGSYLELAKGSSPILAVRFVPLTLSGLTWLDHQESRKTGPDKGKLTAEEFDSLVDATPKAFYKEKAAQLAACRESLARLEELCSRKFPNPDSAPSFLKIRTTLEEVENTVGILLKRKLEKDPDPVEPVSAPEGGEAGVVGEGASEAGRGIAADAWLEQAQGEISGLEPRTRQEALLRMAWAARWWRRQDPSNPASYLILRAMRWGELRGKGKELDTALLVAPSSDLRIRMKALASGARWKELIEHGEDAMASECGRGWLDLQRYVVTACEQLGYAAAARAIKSELRCLLRDYPELATATLPDDTGAANPETAAWLADGLKKDE